jgi:hypothetical protein
MVTRLARRFGAVALVAVLWGTALSVLANRYLVTGTSPPLWPMPPNAAWIKPAIASDRAYFRREWLLGARPSSAWIAVAAEDYRLYVNGELVGWNTHWQNAGLAFQNKISDKNQSLTIGRVLLAARSPTAFMRGNREWGIAQVFEIDRLLRPGRNVIAVYVQDPAGAKLKVWGGATLASGTVALGPELWRYSAVEKGLEDDDWYSPRRVDQAWDSAMQDRRPERAIYSRVPVACWALPFDGAMVMLRPDEVRRTLHFNAEDSLGRSAWLRFYATRHVDIVVDGNTILSVPPEQRLWIVDVSDYADRMSDGFEVRLSQQGAWPFSRTPVFAVDVVSDDRIVALATTSGSEPYGVSRDDILQVGNVRKSVIRLLPDLRREMSGAAASVLRWIAVPIAVLGFVWLERHRLGIADARQLGSRSLAVSVPAMVFLAGVELLRFRLFESDSYLVFCDERFRALVSVLFVAISIACVARGFSRPDWPRIPLPRWSDPHVVRRSVIAILLLTAIARVVTLGVEPLQADENVSWDAARGILRDGVPRAVSGVLYTRSPLYHYMLAGWLGVFGDTQLSARMFAIPWAVGATYLTFLIARRVSGSTGAALTAAALVALDPLQIGIAGVIRFYQPMQFFALLCTWAFIRGFLDREARFQDWFFFSAICGVLSQEVFVTLLPAFCTAFFLYYRPFSWQEDARIPLGFSLLLTATIVDVATFSLLCLTPHVGIGTTSGSITQFNTRDIVTFTSTFIAGHNRSNLLYVIAFLGGLFVVRRHSPRERILLALVVVMTLAALTLIVLQVAQRYTVGLHPLLVIGAVTAVHEWLAVLHHRLVSWTGRTGYARFLHRATMACVVIVMGINLEYPKTLGAFESPRVLEHQYALEKIARLRRSGDKVMSVHPMPGAILFGGVDFYLERGSSFDEVYQRGDQVVDRWAGGRLVSRVSELRDVFEENDRVWVVLDEMEKSKLRQAVIDFLYESCSVEFEFKDGQVLLWERGAGKLSKLVIRE